MAPIKDEMTYLHLAYLQQVSHLLKDSHKPLAGRLGYIAKKISQKHVVHVNGADSPKLLHCKACLTPIGENNIKTKEKKLIVRCPTCNFTRTYSISRHNRPKKAKHNKQSRIDDTSNKDET